MALPDSFYTETLADNTMKSNGEPETASWQVPITTITAGNYAATATKLTALRAAIAGISSGELNKSQIQSGTFKTTNPIPSTDPTCQRENKYLLRYHDAINGQKFQVSIPCADLSVHAANSEFIDLAGTEGSALKTAFQDVVVSPNDASHAVVLDSAQFVGRNS